MAVYFMSDQHFGKNEKELEDLKFEKFVKFIDSIRGSESLFIVGDLFSFFFEYGTYIPKEYQRIVTTLTNLKNSGTEIYYIVGNHDFWVGSYFSSSGITTFKKAQSLSIQGKKVFISHGDEFVGRNFLFRYVLRNKIVILVFSLIPPKTGYFIGNMVNKITSMLSHRKWGKISGNTLWKRVNRIGIKKLSDGFDVVIFSHIHIPHWIRYKNKDFVVIGDWIRHFSYGKLENGEFKLCIWR